LKEEGFDIIVSLLTAQESEELGLVHEASVSEGYGVQFLCFPIPDLGVPNSREAAQEFLGTLHHALSAGKKVAIHCRQGIGRSGLVASSLLAMSGTEPANAFRRVSAARGFSVPETSEQRDWVIEFAHEPAEPVAQR
jgi:protein-tyrosine phosphatase